MKPLSIALTILALVFFAASCKNSTEPENNISINVIYYRYPDYSPVAIITWDGGNISVLNKTDTSVIHVPDKALLTATFTRDSHHEINETFTAYDGAIWKL